MTTQKMDKYTALLNQGYLENKIKMIPTTILEKYSDLEQKEPVLVSRELIADGHVMLGVEYSPEGQAVRAYTTDETGKKIGIADIDKKAEYEKYSLRDVISEHLQKIANIKENSKTKMPEDRAVQPNERKVRRTEVSKETAMYVKSRGKQKS